MCSKDDLAKLKVVFRKTDVIAYCKGERMNAKYRFYKLIDPTKFAALLKIKPVVCKEAVLPKSLPTNRTVYCLMFQKNRRHPKIDKLCFVRALALPLLGKQRLEGKASEIFKLFIYMLYKLSPNQFKRVHKNNIPIDEDLLTLNILLYDIDIVDGDFIGENARRGV